MNTEKKCPQCTTSFEGRSNQIYCSPACKQRAFQAGNSRPATEKTSLQPVLSESVPVYAPSLSPQSVHALETLRIQSAHQMKRLEIEEREQLREDEWEREEREFKRERERAEWEREALKIKVSHSPTDTSLFLGKPEGSKEEKSTKLDSDGELNVGNLVAIGLGLALFASLFKNNQPQLTPPPLLPQPPLPPIPPQNKPPKSPFKLKDGWKDSFKID